MWHLMPPMRAGAILAVEPREGCMWGMGDRTYLFADRREYEHSRSLPPADVGLEHAPFVAGMPAVFTVSLSEPDGSPATLFVDMDKLVHVVIASRDETVFAHIHPDDDRPLAQADSDASTFTLRYTFPKAGAYLISVDYAHGLTLASKQFTVEVAGASMQADRPARYPSSGTFGGYHVALEYFQPLAGAVANLADTITKDGQPVTDIVPYLSAAMHISAIKDDFSAFIHTHGEVHPPGVPPPPIVVKDGQVMHSMAGMTLPPSFGPNIEAHLIFPSPGRYTVWGEFKVGSEVIPTSFTVDVE
jgi:hypothetical protein